jgi:LuxR family transcriptional regulator, quorum-sensing system regulator CviR
MNAPEGFFTRQWMPPLAFRSTSADAIARFVVQAAQVRSEQGFLDLARGPLQELLPHEMMLAGLGHAQGERIVVYHAIGINYPDSYLEKLRRSPVLAGPVLSRWLRTSEAQCFDVDSPAFSVPAAWLNALRRNDIRNIAAHGVRDLNGTGACYLTFSRLGLGESHQIRLALESITPVLYQALLRIWRARKRSAPGRPRAAHLTEREREILRWIAQGKTNAEIAQIASRSEYTIRNQVSTVFAKLEVDSRTQAVSAGAKLGMLDQVHPERAS